MLTIDKLPLALTTMGFQSKGLSYSKTIGSATLQVLLDKQEIVYPESAGLVINERQTSINQANINATKMRNIKVPVPPLAQQKRLVAEVQALERKIADAQAVIAGAPARKQAILQRYL